METQPQVVERAAQPYVAIRKSVTMQTVAALADRIPELFGWLGARGVEPAGAPFFKYNVIDMERRLEIEAGIPVGTAIAGDGEVESGVLPAGRYATVTHFGQFDKLIDVTAGLLAWAARQGLKWDKAETEEGDRWACRLEIYETDPSAEPDVNKWETVLAFKLADDSR
jgi:effector-binding domain-containing protein